MQRTCGRPCGWQRRLPPPALSADAARQPPAATGGQRVNFQCDRLAEPQRQIRVVRHRNLSFLKYLARYTHRVAIANRRLLALEDGRVTFRWKDYAHGNRHRTMTLDAVEFLRRFLLHI